MKPHTFANIISVFVFAAVTEPSPVAEIAWLFALLAAVLAEIDL